MSFKAITFINLKHLILSGAVTNNWYVYLRPDIVVYWINKHLTHKSHLLTEYYSLLTDCK